MHTRRVRWTFSPLLKSLRPGWLLGALLLAPLPSSLTTPGALAQPVGGVQIVLTVDQTAAFAGGQPVGLASAPRLLSGRVMVPLRETAALLEQPVSEQGGLLVTGRLSVDSQTLRAQLAGTPQPPGSAQEVGGVVYISARLLAEGLTANFSADASGRVLTITALRGGGNPLLPQARFSTDKSVYAPGERVIYTEYPFDPDGADITARRWTGRQDAFFKPGVYTVSLVVTNARGLQSAPYTRTIRVEGTPLDTPLTYALKYGEPGDSFPDPLVLSYPVLPVFNVPREDFPLLFSDSPEAPTRSGILYQDTVAGRARLLAYHLNALGRPARLYVMARNLETRPVEVRTERLGETAPTRVEGQLGQVTLLEYFADSGGRVLTLEPGQSAPIYASPTLGVGSGVNVMKDLRASGRVELTFVMLAEDLLPTGGVVQSLPYLPLDGKHQRGTFPGAVRALRVDVRQLPARIVIGDGQVDPALLGVDRVTGQPMRLSGNYGVLYELQISGVADTVVALSPRGGLYRGAMHVEDGPLSQTIKLPRVGNALVPEQPVLLWRPGADRINVDFVPASGSNLPISLVFYPSGSQGLSTLLKTYQP